MPNRAERRAQERAQRRGIPQQYDQTNGRGRSGMLDEYALQEKSRRLVEHANGEWKPSGGDKPAVTREHDPNLRNPKALKTPHSIRQWFRVVSWTLIVLAAVAFLTLMWLPSKPLWLIITAAVVFAVGVLSLFVVSGDARHNPNLDAHGTAV